MSTFILSHLSASSNSSFPRGCSPPRSQPGMGQLATWGSLCPANRETAGLPRKSENASVSKNLFASPHRSQLWFYISRVCYLQTEHRETKPLLSPQSDTAGAGLPASQGAPEVSTTCTQVLVLTVGDDSKVSDRAPEGTVLSVPCDCKGGHTETRPPAPIPAPRRLTLQTASWITAAVFKILTEGLVFQAGRAVVFCSGRYGACLPVATRLRAVPSQPLGSRVLPAVT